MSGKLIAIILTATLVSGSVAWLGVILLGSGDGTAAWNVAKRGARGIPDAPRSDEGAGEATTPSALITTSTFVDPGLASDPGCPAVLVVDQIARPVPGAQVWLRSEGEELIYGKTDEKGRFLLRAVPARPFRVDAIAGDLRGDVLVTADSAADVSSLPAWLVARVKIFPERASMGYLSMRLISASGKPARGQSFAVLLYSGDPPVSGPGRGDRRLFSNWNLGKLVKTTDGKGRIFAAVRPGVAGYLEIRVPPATVPARLSFRGIRGWHGPLATVRFREIEARDCEDLGDVRLSDIDDALARGGLAGRVRCKIPSPGMQPALSVGLSEPQRRASRFTPVAIAPDGSFQIGGLHPGTYCLRVSLNRSVEQEVEGLEVVGGQVARPPGISDLIVGLGLYRASITVRNPQGRPIADAEVTLEEDVGHKVRSVEGFTDSAGTATVVLRRNAKISVHVSTPRFCSKDIDDAHFPLDLVMQPGISLEVTLSAALPRIEDAGSYLLRVIQSETTERVGEQSTLSGDGRRATLEGLHHGRYRVAVVFRRSVGTGKWSSRLIVPLGPVTIREKPDRQTVRLSIDPSEVAGRMRGAQ